MNWRPLLTRTEALKLRLNCAPTREVARREFDDFVAGGADDEELELASIHYGYALFRLGVSDEAARARGEANTRGDRRGE